MRRTERPATPAIVARAAVKNSGSIALTVSLVAGSVPPNRNTPAIPSCQSDLIARIAHYKRARLMGRVAYSADAHFFVAANRGGSINSISPLSRQS